MLVSIRHRYVEWGDCDPAQIVFNPRFFEWFDACTAGLLDTAGFNKSVLHSRPDFAGIPLVESRAKFLRPSRFGDTVRIETTATDVRKSSFDIRHQLFNQDELSVEAFETRVWTGPHPDDPKRIKSTPIPDEVVTALRGA
jgi:4-hydroxybenzoyl-CoA thioesterase